MVKVRLILSGLLTAFTFSSVLPVHAQAKTITIHQLDNGVVQAPAVEAAFKEFQKTHPNVTLDHQALANYTEVLPLAITGDNAPDIFGVSDLKPDVLQNLADNGHFYSLDKFKDWPQFLATFPTPNLAVEPGSNELDNIIYSMKFDADLFWQQYYINLNLYEKAGIVDSSGKPIIPTTWKQIVDNGYTIHKKTGAYGFSLAGADPNWMTFFFWTCQLSSVAYGARGLGYDLRTGTFTSANNQCFKQVINDLLKMRDDGVTPPDMLTLADEPNRALFAQDKVATIHSGVWAITGWQQTDPKFTNYTSIPIPLVNVDKPYQYFPKTPASTSIAISDAAAKDPDVLAATWEWYKFIYSPAYAKINSDMGNGLSIFTPGDPAQYATQQNRGYYESAKFYANTPEVQLPLRNPDISKLQQTLKGPSEGEVLTGLYSKQLTDVDAALADLDARYTAAYKQALSDAQGAGANITAEDFIVRDWDPSKSYDTPLKPGYYPGAAPGAAPTGVATQAATPAATSAAATAAPTMAATKSS